jgi:hypothetical protein
VGAKNNFLFARKDWNNTSHVCLLMSSARSADVGQDVVFPNRNSTTPSLDSIFGTKRVDCTQ